MHSIYVFSNAELHQMNRFSNVNNICIYLVFDLITHAFQNCGAEWMFPLIRMTSSNVTFSALLDFCARNSPVTGEFPAQRPVWRGALMFSLICAWINGWVNNGETGDLRNNRAHYDVTVLLKQKVKPVANLLWEIEHCGCIAPYNMVGVAFTMVTCTGT